MRARTVGVMVAAAVAAGCAERRACREAQAEARGALLRLVEKERAFQASWGYFTGDLRAIGYEPPPSARYLVGFHRRGPGLGRGYRPPDDYDEARHHSAHREVSFAPGSGGPPRRSDGGPVGPEQLPAESVVTVGDFRASAVADLLPGAALDVWTIDATGRIEHRVDECR